MSVAPIEQQRFQQNHDPMTTISRHKKKAGDNFAVYPIDMEFPTLASQLDTDVLLAATDDNEAGSFKFRGALSAMQAYRDNEGVESVVVPSAGNFARGAVLAGRILDMSVTVVVPENAPPKKKEGINDIWPGGRLNIVPHGKDFDQSLSHAEVLSGRGRGTLLHPYDDQYVIAGQGTLVDELLAVSPETKHIVLPSGGGGLGAGVVNRLAQLGRNDIQVHPIEAYGSDSLSKSLEAYDGWVYEATNPNKLYGGSAVKKCGRKCLQLYMEAGYTAADVTGVDDDEVARVAGDYLNDRLELLRDNTDCYEPTTLVAVAGLAKLSRLRKLDGNTVVLGTGHNAPVEDMFTSPVARNRFHAASAQVPLRQMIYPGR